MIRTLASAIRRSLLSDPDGLYEDSVRTVLWRFLIVISTSFWLGATNGSVVIEIDRIPAAAALGSSGKWPNPPFLSAIPFRHDVLHVLLFANCRVSVPDMALMEEVHTIAPVTHKGGYK